LIIDWHWLDHDEVDTAGTGGASMQNIDPSDPCESRTSCQQRQQGVAAAKAAATTLEAKGGYTDSSTITYFQSVTFRRYVVAINGTDTGHHNLPHKSNHSAITQAVSNIVCFVSHKTAARTP